MFAQESKGQQHNHYSKKRLILVIIALLLLVGGAIIWILNLLGIIDGPWSRISPVIFTLLGVAFTLFQWILPLSFHSPKIPVDSYRNKLDHEPERSYMRVEGIDLGINKYTGALVIYAKKAKLGESVDLRRNHILPLAHSTSNIVRRIINNQTVYSAIFLYLEPSDYIACDASGNYRTKITVLPDQVTEIDWRGTRKSKVTTKLHDLEISNLVNTTMTL